MVTQQDEKVLYIDAKYYHLEEENAIAVHPKKLSMLSLFEKDSFDKAIIMNSPTEFLKAHGFFNICRVLKLNSKCEVTIDQPIVVMQNLELSEIEAIAKLGGFSNIQKQTNETSIKQHGKDIKIQTAKLTMTKITKENK